MTDEFPDNSVSVYTYNFPRDCGSFDETWRQYLNDGSDYVLFIVLVNLDNNKGIVGFHFKSNYQHQSQELKSVNEDYTIEEAYEGVKEITDEADVCTNLILAYGQRFQYQSSNFFNGVFHNEKDENYFKGYYNTYQEKTRKVLTNAQKDFSYYYELEYNFLKESGSWRLTSWIKARTHLCSGVIHNVLMACGLIEGVGAVCDGLDAVIYYLEGDVGNSKIAALAMTPGIGIYVSGTKIGTKVLHSASNGSKVVVQFSVKTVGNTVK